MTRFALFVACMTGPVPLCEAIPGPYSESVATGWVGERAWQWWDYDGTLCRSGKHRTCLRFDVDGDWDVDLMDYAEWMNDGND